MGLTHLDAGVVIGLLDADDVHHPSSIGALNAAIARGDALAMASSAVAECLVGPAGRGTAAIETVLGLLERTPISVIDIDIDIATRAAALRAAHPTLKLPDAFVIATAVIARADLVVTTDRKWPPASTMDLDVVIDQL